MVKGSALARDPGDFVPITETAASLIADLKESQFLLTLEYRIQEIFQNHKLLQE